MYDIYDNDFDKAFDEAVDAIEKKAKEHKLIWADELIKAHYDYCNEHRDAAFPMWSMDLMMNAKAVDAEPTKHGRWDNKVIYSDNKVALWCSECGKQFFKLPTENGEYNYCPNCGPRMDGGENG